MFVSSRKQSMVPLDKRLQWRNVKKSEPWHIQNPDIYRTLEYSEPWHIQNPAKHLQWIIFTKIVNGYNYFLASAFQVLYFMKNYDFFLNRSNLNSRSIYLMQNMGPKGTGGRRP